MIKHPDTEGRINQLNELIEKLNIKINNMDIIDRAFTHSSYVNENKHLRIESNEKLEFLGDAVIGLVITEHIYRLYPDYTEGELSKMKSRLVSATVLAKLSDELLLGDYILLGKGEEKSGGKKRSSTLANAFESIIGAIYLDSGFKEASHFIINKFDEQFLSKEIGRDYKSELQEFSQKKFRVSPVYSVISEVGPEHKKLFEVRILIKGREYGRGIGKSKKEAEQKASANTINFIRKGEI